jgi:transposase
MRFVPIKSEAQQAMLVLHRARDLLVRQRTSLVNALRGHLAEFGVVLPKGGDRPQAARDGAGGRDIRHAEDGRSGSAHGWRAVARRSRRKSPGWSASCATERSRTRPRGVC